MQPRELQRAQPADPAAPGIAPHSVRALLHATAHDLRALMFGAPASTLLEQQRRAVRVASQGQVTAGGI